mmetsp:Transcript_62517/g.184914  ORF Transcript_62517/g.184914 Transcript_62517/m.184914 type:complete len:100 (-) Transcript_62517:1874-2173(-)
MLHSSNTSWLLISSPVSPPSRLFCIAIQRLQSFAMIMEEKYHAQLLFTMVNQTVLIECALEVLCFNFLRPSSTSLNKASMILSWMVDDKLLLPDLPLCR